MFWPLTPSMVIQHSANYNAMAQTHSNYPFQAYQNSQVDSLNIIGEFPVQNSEDAKHWVATVNFLRTATKMFFGRDEGERIERQSTTNTASVWIWRSHVPQGTGGTEFFQR